MKKIVLVLALLISFSLVFADSESAGFTPSATAKSAPEIVSPRVGQIKDLNKKKTVVIPTEEAAEAFTPAEDIKNSDPIILVSDNKGKLGDIVGAVKQVYVPIVPYAEKEILNSYAKEQITIAYNELKNASSFADLAPELQDFIDEKSEGKLVATQLFFMGPNTGVQDFLRANQKLNLRIIFKKALTTGTNIPYILVKDFISGKWSAIDPKTVLEDWYVKHSFSADFRSYGAVVFLEIRNN